MSSLWNRRSGAAMLLLAGLIACDEPSPLPPPDGGGGGSTPLVIDSTRPADNAVDAPYGQAVYAFTDSAVQAPTLTVTSYTIVTDAGAFDVPRKVALIGPNQLQANASLLPGTKYRATIATSLLSTNGGALAAPHTWTFTTRPIVPFVLASGSTGFFGRLALAKDSTGGIHAVYADSVLPRVLYYAECSGTCAAAANWTVLDLDPLHNVGSSSAIAVDRSGRVHIVFRSDRQQSLQYATCQSPCTDLSQFAFATVDNSSIEIGVAPSIAVTPDGIVHTTYYDPISAYLRYAVCLAACTLDASWVTGTADPGGAASFVGQSSSIVVDGPTRHVVYQDSAGNSLRYATCIHGLCGRGHLADRQHQPR